MDAATLGLIELALVFGGVMVFGLWQIRSLVADAGTGRERDGTRLYDPTFNARAAWTISSGGTNWRPWTVYATGAYRTHLEDARRAIASAGVTGGAGGSARIL